MDKNLPPNESGKGQRLMSVDALRGFDMFWIIGADLLVHALCRTSFGSRLGILDRQLTHSTWSGFTFYDLILPLFICWWMSGGGEAGASPLCGLA